VRYGKNAIEGFKISYIKNKSFDSLKKKNIKNTSLKTSIVLIQFTYPYTLYYTDILKIMNIGGEDDSSRWGMEPCCMASFSIEGHVAFLSLK